MSDTRFSIWKRKGLATVKDLYINVFASFDQLKRKLNLQPTNFFRYLQIRNYARIHFETYNLPDELFSLLNKDPEIKKLVSMFVIVFAAKTAPSTQHLKESWQEEIGTTVSENAWCKCLYNIHTCSINARHQLIQYKVVHRLHYSSVKLHSFFPSTSAICVQCKQTDGTLAHMFWFCSKLSRFWCEILNFYSEVSGHDPPIPILG